MADSDNSRSPSPVVGVIMGSASDYPVMSAAVEMLTRFEVPHEVKVTSAHRSPDRTREYAEKASERGIKALVVGAGGAAHLAGVVAAHCLLPVLAVPVSSSKLVGLDALLASVQMPSGIPVGCLAIDGAANAALLAIEILALEDDSLRQRLVAYRVELSEKTLKRSEELELQLGQRQ